MKPSNSIYTAAMTGCGFMPDEMSALLPLLLSDDADALLKKETEENNLLLIKSESSRKRTVYEFKRRFNAVPRSFWEWYDTLSADTKRWAMFYVNLKTYRLYFDFQINVVLDRWRSISQEVTYSDIQSEIYQIAANDEFVDSWSEDTVGRGLDIFEKFDRYSIASIRQSERKCRGFAVSINETSVE